jgi:hypothetical protein
MGCMSEELWFSFKQGETDLSPFPGVQNGLEAQDTCSKDPAGTFVNCYVMVVIRCNFIVIGLGVLMFCLGLYS